MNVKEERTCPTCAHKATCLERTTMLHYMFIATGRSDELTDEVKEKFGFKGDCKNWLGEQNKNSCRKQITSEDNKTIEKRQTQ